MDGQVDSRATLKKLALELLIRNGYRGLNFGDIAKTAGTTRANLHYHFGGKAELVDEVIADYVSETLDQLAKIWEPRGTPLSAKVASMLVNHVLQAGPRREAVGDANLLNSGKIHNANVEVARVNGAGFDVILDAFGQSGKHKLKSGAARLRLHGELFPF